MLWNDWKICWLWWQLLYYCGWSCEHKFMKFLQFVCEYLWNLFKFLAFLPTTIMPTSFQLNNQPSNLDHVWLNSSNPLVTAVLNVDLMDHYPTFLLFNFHSDRPVNSDIVYSFWPFSQQNMDTFILVELLNVDWDDTTVWQKWLWYAWNLQCFEWNLQYFE